MGTQSCSTPPPRDAVLQPLVVSAPRPARRLSSRPSLRRILPGLTRLLLAVVLALPAGLLGEGARPVLAAAGDLDPTFGMGGKVLTDFGGSIDSVRALAVQPDGKLVAGGSVGAFFKLTRFLPNGALDPSFGNGGLVTADFGGTSLSFAASLRALAVQPDGKHVAAGSRSSSQTGTFSDFALVRYLSDGALDPSFGTGGRVVTASFGTLDAISALAVQPDGKLVVGGLWGGGPPCCVGTLYFALARYLPDGAPDPSFGTPIQGVPPGFVLLENAGSARHLVLQPDGKLVAATGGALLRFLPGGALDPSFGAAGRVAVDFAPLNELRGLVLQPDGKLAVAIDRSAQGADADFFLGRYLPNGAPDPSFGAGGRVTADFGGGASSSAEPGALALQADGKLVVAGGRAILTGPEGDFGLARYLPNGAPDPSFGTGGRVTTDFGFNEGVKALAVQADGKLVALGVSLDPSTNFPSEHLALARYDSAGGARVTIGGRGLGITPRVGIDLTWTAGNLQLGYLVARDPDASATLPAGAAAFTDVAPAWPPALNCYVLVPFGSAGPLGLSDALCARQGLASPAVAGPPRNFTLRLHESATASLSWSPPQGLQQLGYLLLAVPFDGRPPRVIGLPAGATRATDPTGGAFTCYQLHVVHPVGVAQTDLVCGLPGVAQFPATAAEAGRAEGREPAAAAAPKAAAPAAARAAATEQKLDHLLREGRTQVEQQAGKLRQQRRPARR